MNSQNREELFQQLSRAVELRSSQDQVLWSIFGFFGTTNAVLLTALFASGDFPKNYGITLTIAIVGLSVSVTWHLIQTRALGHCKRYEALIATLEQILAIPENLALSASINTALFQNHLGTGGIPVRTLLAKVAWFTAALWIFIMLAGFIIR